MFLDPISLLFMIPGLILGIYAQIRLSAAYNKNINVGVQSGMSGAEASREILNQAGLPDVNVEEIGGHLTDHYDPMKKTLFLSSENFQGRSIAAVGVAAHEAGHALQHQAATGDRGDQGGLGRLGQVFAAAHAAEPGGS